MKIKEHKIYKDYLITSNGSIIKKNYRNTGKNQILKLQKSKKGYSIIGFWINKKVKTQKVHRLVAETFIANPENKPQVNHKDGNKQNNHVNNLEWSTNQENQLHSYRVLKRKPSMMGKFGKNNHKSKKVKQICIKTGKIIKIWDAICEAAKFHKVSHGNISGVCRGDRRTCRGFRWEYANS